MVRYMVSNTHTPVQCEEQEEAVQNLPEWMKGQDFYCTCMAGEHAFYMFVEGETSEEVLGKLPPSLLIGKTRAVEVDVWQL